DEPLGAGALVLADALADLRRRAGEMPRPDEVGQRAEHELELLLLLLCARLVGADGEAHVAGTNDRPRITPLLLAPVVQGGVAHGGERGRREGRVPAVGVARDHAEQSPLALPADPQPEARLHRPRLAERVVEVHLLAMERDALAVEQASENRDGLLE